MPGIAFQWTYVFRYEGPSKPRLMITERFINDNIPRNPKTFTPRPPWHVVGCVIIGARRPCMRVVFRVMIAAFVVLSSPLAALPNGSPSSVPAIRSRAEFDRFARVYH